jgi:hypothetical protein
MIYYINEDDYYSHGFCFPPRFATTVLEKDVSKARKADSQISFFINNKNLIYSF